MIACVDVGYDLMTARAACVTFERWEDAHTSGEYVLDTSDVRPYVPGEFYKRELPCALAVLKQLPMQPDLVVVDGYVWLDDRDRMGLDVSDVWRAFADQFDWVAGVAGNHDTFGPDPNAALNPLGRSS